MNDLGYAYRIRITRNYAAPEVRFDALISAVPIHVLAQLDNSMMPHSAVHEADQLLKLLTEALGRRSEALEVLNEAMSGRSVERNLGPFVTAELLGKLCESDAWRNFQPEPKERIVQKSSLNPRALRQFEREVIETHRDILARVKAIEQQMPNPREFPDCRYPDRT
jgi:hypothetical protein